MREHVNMEEGRLRIRDAAQWLEYMEPHMDRMALGAPGKKAAGYFQLRKVILDGYKALRGMGISRRGRVALLAPGGAVSASAVLTVLVSAACAPLNPSMGEEELTTILARLKPALLIAPPDIAPTGRGVAEKLGIPVADMIIDESEHAGFFTLKGEPAAVPSREGLTGEHDMAFLIHTPGSVEQPKLVGLSQGNVFSSAYFTARSLELTSGDVCLNFLPLFHNHGVMASLMASVSVYASVFCLPVLEARGFWEGVEQWGATWFGGAPSSLQRIAHWGEARPVGTGETPLRFIRSSSFHLSPYVMNRLERAFRVPVIEAYGMTETAHQITSNPLPPGRRKPGSAGVAQGVEIAVLGPHGGLLPPDRDGEIIVRGDSVCAEKYCRIDSLVEKIRVKDGEKGKHDLNWFRTGDYGRLDAEGYLFLTGRGEEFIRRGGELIAPREIEEALLEHEQVLQAVAFPVLHPRLGQGVAAAVVPADNEYPGEDALRLFISRRLPPSHVPQQIIFTSAIPAAPSGKIRRNRLAEAFASSLRHQYEPPRSNTEKILAFIWRWVLHAEQAGLYDNFFTLGGDSLLMTRLHALIREYFSIEIIPLDLFRHPSLASMAALIEGKAGKDADPSALEAAETRLGDWRAGHQRDDSEPEDIEPDARD